MQTSNNNPLLCDPTEGFCGLPEESPNTTGQSVSTDSLIKVIYFTDPICSSCWGIEPQLRKLKLEYGHQISIDYHMGGLLPDWSYNSGGISKPSDVAHHWDEVSQYYEMPIDGDVWLQDPLHSSYPPSIAFKAAQMQDKEKAIIFLRKMREMVFMQHKNITRWQHIETAALQVGLNTEKLKADYNGPANALFQQDLAIAKQYGVKGFPTMYFVNSGGERQMVYGTKPYDHYKSAIKTLAPGIEKSAYATDWKSLFSKYPSLTAKEFAVLAGVSYADSQMVLQDLTAQNLLLQVDCKNGGMWYYEV